MPTKILTIVAIVLGLMSGCDMLNKYKEKPAAEQPANAEYQGQVNGCIEHYDPLYCPDKYKPGYLNANNVSIIKDDNGTPVIINRDRK